jgi:hypothetical protein
MKRYTLRTLIHDRKIFNQLRRDYRQAKTNRRTHSTFGELFRSLAAMTCSGLWLQFLSIPLRMISRGAEDRQPCGSFYLDLPVHRNPGLQKKTKKMIAFDFLLQ